MPLRHFMKIGCLCLLFISFVLSASEKVLLEINALSESVNTQYTLAQLLQLPQQEISCKLPWSDKLQRYTGPYLEDVFKHAGVEGRWLTMTGLDNYKIPFSYQKIKKYKPILALQADDLFLSVRSKGPIMLVLPIDEYQELNSTLYHDYMVWQLIKIDISDKE